MAETVTLGLIAAPDIPEKIAEELASELPDLLGGRVDGSVSWEVPVVVDPVTGTDREAPEILDECRERMLGEAWDLAICLTDLPVYRGGALVAADVSTERGVAGLSLPVLGATRLRPRARELTLRLAGELHERTEGHARETPPARGSRARGSVGPFRMVDPPDEDMEAMDVDARFVAPGARGHIGLWSGMVLANRPWKLFPSFRTAIAVAFATGAYALITPTVWILADVAGWARLLALMVLAVAAMAAWIVVAHELWEWPDQLEAGHWIRLYNGVTLLTMTVAVLLAYAALFVQVLIAAWVFVPGSYLQTNLKHPIGPGEYAIIAWMTASLATVAGALGSGLEDEDTVREAAYGYRQRLRQEDDPE